MKKENVLFVVVLFFLVCSCNNEPEILTRTELISAHFWKVTSKKIDPPMTINGFVVSNIMPFDADSVRNYLYKFQADGIFTVYNENNIPLFETNWSFNVDETSLLLEEPLVFVYPIFGGIPLSTVAIDTITTTYIRASVPYEYESNIFEMLIVFNDSAIE